MRKGVALQTAQAAKPRASQQFATLVGEEVAVGIVRLGDEGFGLKVNLTAEPPETVTLPDEVEGVPVEVEVVGKIRKR
jgi:hypothetical protein